MQWFGRKESGNVEDRRGFTGGRIAAGGGIIGVIVLVINLLMGGDAGTMLNQMQDQNKTEQTPGITDPEEDKMAKFISVALADNEDVWKDIFRQMGKEYEEPKLVLFRQATESGCGDASSASGPFYCPDDRKIYIDLSFMDELRNRFGAKGGEFALAYVLAHEVGHHVQNLLGVSSKVKAMKERVNKVEANKLSVALELQADFYAGVWANHEEQINHTLEAGDIEDAMNAANAIGDDAIQKKAEGRVVPDAFTHGTSQQRVAWFTKGYKTGNMNEGNTFDQLQ
ncbi:MAG: zinc metallopeptidase [Bacteroidia bacterium]|nr:zinc metallopeptidase [Bacteroidia bacterium]